jgi:polysaccharide pyruvyl transferase WcaK-like protein
MPRALLTGTYCSRNKGDAAMQIAAALELRRQIAGIEVVLASPFPEIDRPVYAPYGIEVVPSHRRHLGHCLAQMMLGSCHRRLIHALPTPDVLAIEQADFVLDLSGDGLTEDYGPHVVLSHLYPIWLALALGKKVMLGAQTIGPFRTLGPLVGHILDRVDCITPRDRFTEEGLRSLGVRRPILERTADLAHLLDPATPPVLQGQAPSPRAGERPILGVTVSRLLGHRQSLGWLRKSRETLEVLAQALESLIRKQGFEVLRCPSGGSCWPCRRRRRTRPWGWCRC